MAESRVVGVDGGGTYTRAMVADTEGRVLALAEAGGSNPNHHPHAEENARAAIQQALAAAGVPPGQVVSMVAGFAGLDAPEDQEWADRFTAVPGLTAPRLQVNDAVIAHAGALRSRPGIIAISGTGSIVLGVTPAGRQIRNYDFHQYASSTARHLAYETVFRVIAGETEPADREFVQEVLAYWGAADLPALAEIGASGFLAGGKERNYRFGGMASRVTEAAARGVPVARAVCDRAAAALGTAVRLVGACFASETVPVALVGSVIRSPYLKRAVEAEIVRSANRPYQVVEPALSSIQGAVLMALERCGRTVDDALVRTVDQSTQAVSAAQSSGNA